ncbi:MAG TPA: hydroxyacylglutathione hydrolase [Polyangiaceae bacterium]|jgi:hydroxyacylglutathione hydrolase|nr:hydroxyacylglutathione hydrolase [Polyangiaceae bacterium]
MRVVIVPCLKDNFTYLVGAGGLDVAVVDPCDPVPVLAAADREGLRISAILNTHHHADHVGGNKRILERFAGIPVYAHRSDAARIPGMTHAVDEGDEVVAAGLRYRVLFVPGHTSGHIAYVTDGAAFVGDTLFGAGCGRLFEGTPEMMNDSLNAKLARLPPETRVYFAHEYTANNLRFAEHVEPGNPAVQARSKAVAVARERGEWTTPSTIALERATNPFMRVDAPEIVARYRPEFTHEPTAAEIFAKLRSAKDHF